MMPWWMLLALLLFGALAAALSWLLSRVRARTVLVAARGMVAVALGVVAVGAVAGVWRLAVPSSSACMGAPACVYGDRIELAVETSTWTGGDPASRRPQAEFVRREFGPSAAPRDAPVTAVVTIPRPTTAERLLALVPGALMLAAVALFLWCLYGLLASAEAGRAFEQATVRRLRWMAVAVLVAGPLASLVTQASTLALLDGRGGDALPALTLSLIPFAAALLLAALAEVWRHGIDLQRDVEATI